MTLEMHGTGAFKKWYGLLIIWGVIMMAYPFSIPQALNLPAKIIMGIGMLLLVIPIFLNLKKIQLSSNIAYIFLIQVILSIIYLIIHKDDGYLNFCFQIIFPFIIYLYINSFLKNREFQSSLLTVMATMGVLSILTFLLCLIITLPFYATFENPDGRTAYNFIISFTNVVFDIGFVRIIRPAGFFDEPGTLAFYLIATLLINDLTFNNKVVRIIFIVAGVFTLSLAFYLIMLFYTILYLDRRLIKRGFFMGVFIISAFLILYSKLAIEQQEIINSYTIGRLQDLVSPDASEDYFKADNRTDLIDNSIEAIKDSPLIGQGISYASKEGGKFNGTFMGANLLGIFGVHGIIGGLIFSLHVFYYIIICFRKRNWLNVPQKSCLVYILLILQRPDFIGGILPYIVVLILVLSSLNYNMNESKNFNNNGGIQ